MERIYVIQPIFNDNYKVLHDEIVALIDSDGASYCGTIYQIIREINPATVIGSGKLAELKEIICGFEDDICVLFNGELSPSQTLNISAALGDVKVIDRTTLILDIFAKNAQSNEGKIQVELAQLKYLYPRLKGKGEALSRLGGGIGTRGPGETQLETDRRHIRARIQYLENRLEITKKTRELQTKRRNRNEVFTIALVGYTNTGKSTLLNTLTGSDVLVRNALFATLDPTARNFKINDVDFILIDTVGFLQELPHDLIEAFQSTLESSLDCDLALIVCDAKADYKMQYETTMSTLINLGFSSQHLVVMNKCDDLSEDELSDLPNDSVKISATKGLGLDELKRQIWYKFQERYITTTLFVPYSEFNEYNKINSFLTQKNIEYGESEIAINVVIPTIYLSKFDKWIRK